MSASFRPAPVRSAALAASCVLSLRTCLRHQVSTGICKSSSPELKELQAANVSTPWPRGEEMAHVFLQVQNSHPLLVLNVDRKSSMHLWKPKPFFEAIQSLGPSPSIRQQLLTLSIIPIAHTHGLPSPPGSLLKYSHPITPPNPL